MVTRDPGSGLNYCVLSSALSDSHSHPKEPVAPWEGLVWSVCYLGVRRFVHPMDKGGLLGQWRLRVSAGL